MAFGCCRRKPPSAPRLPCAVRRCTNRVLKCDAKMTTGRTMYSQYCSDHACRHRVGDSMCPTAKASGPQRFCEDHSCHVRPCEHKRVPGSRMCDIHTPRCLIPDCGGVCPEGSLYCAAHNCLDADCDGLIYGSGWCRGHRGCEVTGCERERVGAGEKLPGTCAIHTPRDCCVDGCETKVVGETRGCPKHECAYATCQNLRDPSKPSNFCKNHTCTHPPCANLTSLPSSPASKFCPSHTCSSSSSPSSTPCPHPSKPGSAHCALHSCVRESCPSPRTGDPLLEPEAQYCASHECASPGCRLPASSSLVPFCEARHACPVAGCGCERGVGERCCGGHMEWLVDILKRETGEGAGRDGRGGESMGRWSGPVQEMLGRRIEEEDQRLEAFARLGRKWENSGSKGRGRGRGRGVRGMREGSVDSGIGSEDSGARTFVY
ncbi:uncharacterized protein DNG_08033 [Cephalotrichum gorgonifer]|uniref:Uncharacterized protein n=1 Tax=Cephalotrichum gorgonifer TaxID=2041049 RepID=A0AAE8N2Q5_9PEZI|nr:uncharacterized protein DNG_08033 [Cephalotrichum gorgonifer]